MILFHPSSIGLLMSDAQSIDPAYLNTEELRTMARKTKKSDEEKAILEPLKEKSLSAGAKTELKTMAKEFVFGYHKMVETKFMDKGLACEDKAIALLNQLWLKRYKKNTVRVKDEFLTGECDIDDGDETLDTKVSWDLSTFPILAEDADDPMYKWQGVAYMRLYNKKRHKVVFVMLDTPDDLLKPWDQIELHKMEDRIPLHMRVTSITYERDMEAERKMIAKLTVARDYLMDTIARINLEHKEHA
jgi:hypothetical protein